MVPGGAHQKTRFIVMPSSPGRVGRRNPAVGATMPSGDFFPEENAQAVAFVKPCVVLQVMRAPHEIAADFLEPLGVAPLLNVRHRVAHERPHLVPVESEDFKIRAVTVHARGLVVGDLADAGLRADHVDGRRAVGNHRIHRI